MPPPADAAARIAARIAASYARRELDRKVYDRILDSALGQRLCGLPDVGKYGLEFFLYAATAVAADRHRGDTNAARIFLTEVLADAPAEIARRMINGRPDVSRASQGAQQVCPELTDAEFESLLDSVRGQDAEFGDDTVKAGEHPRLNDARTADMRSRDAANQSDGLARRATSRIERMRRKIRGETAEPDHPPRNESLARRTTNRIERIRRGARGEPENE